MTATTDACNASRYRAGEANGFYESYFLRANHPARPLAFWIRYTVFVPHGEPAAAQGELWAICFDGDTGRVVAVREAMPMADCAFSPQCLDARVGAAVLDGWHMEGSAASGGHRLAWSLRYGGGGAPLLLLPQKLYEGGFPKAKALVAQPNAIFDGTLTVDGDTIAVQGWRGSQNHNWGSRHTDRYAWGQVAGFDNAPGAFLECATAQVRLGPLWSPRLSFLVLRDEGEEYAVAGLLGALRARGRFDFFHWTLDAPLVGAHISLRIEAPATAFVGLGYRNPPGGIKTCLNSKLASASVTLRRPGRADRVLTTQHRAAFEILTDRSDHGVPLLA